MREQLIRSRDHSVVGRGAQRRSRLARQASRHRRAPSCRARSSSSITRTSSSAIRWCRKSTSPRSAGRRRKIDDIMALAIRVNDFLCGLFSASASGSSFKMECGRLWENDLMRMWWPTRFPRTRAGYGISSRITGSTGRFRAISAVCPKPIRMWQTSRHHERTTAGAPDRCW